MTAREALRRVTEEIGGYPRPIAECDARFDHLLERRSELEARKREEEVPE